MAWFVYIAWCADDTLYTGITTDVIRRLAEHNTSNRLGAKYTRSRRPVALAYIEEVSTRAAAARREREIRHLDRRGKERLVAGWQQGWGKALTGTAPGSRAEHNLLSY
jgi:putative endonuclease